MSPQINLHWIASGPVSCFHAALALLRKQPLVNASLAAALAEPAEKLQALLTEEHIPEEVFWEHLIPLSAGIGSNHELAEVTLRKTIGQEGASSRVSVLSALLAGLRTAFRATLPKVNEQLSPTIEPLRQRWDYLGPGLLAGIANWTEPGVLVEEAAVVLVYPALGGGGGAHFSYNMARIEGVPTDPLAELPEVLRLAWLVSMLNVDLPRYSENLRPNRFATVAGLAMIPIVLTAAGELELAGSDDKAISLAVKSWMWPREKTGTWSRTLNEWWETYGALRPAWATALQALDRLLE